MATLIAIPILALALLLQTTIVSRIPLLQGTADLVLLTLVSWVLNDRVVATWQWALIAGLFVGWLSALPVWVYPLAFALVTGVTLLLRRRVWQIPILALLSMAVLGTLITQALTFIVLRIGGSPLDFFQAFNRITLPSLLLNLLLAIPVYGLISEVARWVYPPEIEI